MSRHNNNTHWDLIYSEKYDPDLWRVWHNKHRIISTQINGSLWNGYPDTHQHHILTSFKEMGTLDSDEF